MDPTLPKISLVMPNYNQAVFIERALLSILDQKYPNLELIVIDGGSTDGSLDIIKHYAEKLAYWVSEPDKGMYDALNKGFSKSTGDIMCWLNSDDILWPDSLMYVSKLFSVNKSLNWLQGYPTVINEEGDLIYERPPVSSKYFFFLKFYQNTYTFIQQESTFWRRSLWIKAGATLNPEYKVAADFDLWMRFFRYEKMYCSNHKLGAFRVRKGQLSENQGKYLSEANHSVSKNLGEVSIFEKLYIQLLLFLKRSNLKIFNDVFKMLTKSVDRHSTYIEGKIAYR